MHARGAQHAPHVRVDGQDPGLAPPKPPAQIPAKVHRCAAPSGHAKPGQPGGGRSSQEARGRPPQRERRAQPQSRSPPELSPGDAGDVEALVKTSDLIEPSCVMYLIDMLLR